MCPVKKKAHRCSPRMDSFGKRSVQHNLDLDFFVGHFGNGFWYDPMVYKQPPPFVFFFFWGGVHFFLPHPTIKSNPRHPGPPELRFDVSNPTNLQKTPNSPQGVFAWIFYGKKRKGSHFGLFWPRTFSNPFVNFMRLQVFFRLRREKTPISEVCFPF